MPLLDCLLLTYCVSDGKNKRWLYVNKLTMFTQVTKGLSSDWGDATRTQGW